MPIHNADIAAIFGEIADRLEVEDANPFRVRAYRNAARMVGELGRSVAGLIEQGADLEALPGIGPDLAARMREIVATGSCALLTRLRQELPPAITELLALPGIGPKRVRSLHRELDVQTVAQLHDAALQQRIRSLHGFGPKTEAQILARDGHDSIEAMAEAAREGGLEYLAITDHSRRLAMAHGLDAARLARQIDHIDQLNERLRGISLLKGIEVDILEDGALDLPDSILQRLDLVVGAVHHRFDLPRRKQTERLLRAIDQRHFSILAHPTGRLKGERDPYDIDLQRVLRHARQRGCFVELNSRPARLDLDDTACQMAKAEGVLVSLNSDAHSGLEFDDLCRGVGQARRGWLEKDDVLNTRSLSDLRALLERTM